MAMQYRIPNSGVLNDSESGKQYRISNSGLLMTETVVALPSTGNGNGSTYSRRGRRRRKGG